MPEIPEYSVRLLMRMHEIESYKNVIGIMLELIDKKIMLAIHKENYNYILVVNDEEPIEYTEITDLLDGLEEML